MSYAQVEVRVDVYGQDGLPHTFLHVTHPDGSTSQYGLVPADMLGSVAVRDIREVA